MANPQLQRLADSAALKVLQYAVTGLMVPAVLWYGGKTLERLDRMEALLAQANVDRATTELRLQQVERQMAERAAVLNDLRDMVRRHEFELQQLRATPAK